MTTTTPTGSCLLVFKNRDKSRLEVAMILNESNVIIQEKSPTDIGEFLFL